MEERLRRFLEVLRRTLPGVYGVVFSLFFITLLGDTHSVRGGFPVGWLILWLLSTILCTPVGVYILLSPRWRALPLEERRGTAMGYMLIAGFNLLSLALHYRWTTDIGLLFILACMYAGLMAFLYWAMYIKVGKQKEELFP